MNICKAPYPMPKPIAKKRYIKSSGSLIGVLNLTIDNAPTKPKDKAKEDFTIIITKKIIIVSKGIIELIWCLDDNDFDLTSYVYFKMYEVITVSNIATVKITMSNSSAEFDS